MASFDPRDPDSDSSQWSHEVTKYPIKRLDLSIKKFVKVLEIDLERLFKHTTNISKLTNAEDWKGLHREQVNTTRTIQQIKANIKEIERTRLQVNDVDLPQFDEKVQDIKSKAIVSMEECLHFIGMRTQHTASDCVQLEQNDIIHLGAKKQSPPISFKSENNDYPMAMEDNFDGGGFMVAETPYGSLPAELGHMQTPLLNSLHVVPQNSHASASWEQLQESLIELNELVNQFAAEVEQQGEVINTIEDNIEIAHEHVKEGTKNLAKAAKYKSFLFPVVGAVVGGAMAGPIGFVAGLKIGGLAGAVGTAVGFAGGRFVKKHQDRISEMEMNNLSDRRSVSLPDLPDRMPAESKKGSS